MEEKDNVENIDNIKNDSITAPKKRGATKGQLSDKTKEALAKGREKLNKKWEEDRNEKAQLLEKYAIKKANKKIKEKLGIKKQMGISEEDTEEEEPIKVIQPIKPKKKQTIILPEKSDSEEEIVYKKPKPKVETKIEPNIKPSEGLRIVFF